MVLSPWLDQTPLQQVVRGFDDRGVELVELDVEYIRYLVAQVWRRTRDARILRVQGSSNLTKLRRVRWQSSNPVWKSHLQKSNTKRSLLVRMHAQTCVIDAKKTYPPWKITPAVAVARKNVNNIFHPNGAVHTNVTTASFLVLQRNNVRKRTVADIHHAPVCSRKSVCEYQHSHHTGQEKSRSKLTQIHQCRVLARDQVVDDLVPRSKLALRKSRTKQRSRLYMTKIHRHAVNEFTCLIPSTANCTCIDVH